MAESVQRTILAAMSTCFSNNKTAERPRFLNYACQVFLVEHIDKQVLQFIKFFYDRLACSKASIQVYDQVHLIRKILTIFFFFYTRASKTCEGKTCYRKRAHL